MNTDEMFLFAYIDFLTVSKNNVSGLDPSFFDHFLLNNEIILQVAKNKFTLEITGSLGLSCPFEAMSVLNTPHSDVSMTLGHFILSKNMQNL